MTDIKPPVGFTPRNDCTLCPLHQTATHPGIPTRPLHVDGKAVAVLFIGEAPGANEDKAGTSWIGFSGDLLQRFIAAARLTDYADIYLANACRCRPPQKGSPTTGTTNKCRPYLQADLDALAEQYDEVILFCCGRWGVEAATKLKSISAALKRQAQDLSSFTNGLKPPVGKTVRVFATYHPALLHVKRDPAKIPAVAAHFTLVNRYLTGDMTPDRSVVTPLFGGPVPDIILDKATVDIETYGILAGVEQTVFHPMKSLHVDDVPLGQQIVTVAFAYRGLDGQKVNCVYSWRDHRHLIRAWFKKIVQDKTLLIGQNVKFDLLFLMCNDPVLRLWIDPRYLRIDDTMLASFLYFEQRPEKGLKELACLHGIANYDDSTITGKNGIAKDDRDPALHYYNCLDADSTLELYEFTWRKIREKYGADSPKFGAMCEYMRNATLWDVIMLELYGVKMSVNSLRGILKKYAARCKDHEENAKAFDLILIGKGSDKSKRDFMLEVATNLDLLDDRRLQWTEKTKQIKRDVENVNLMLEHSTPDEPWYEPLKIMKAFAEDFKMLTSYLNPLLLDQRKGLVHNGFAYPSWYPFPRESAKESNDDGGTIQARFAAKKPPVQTLPEEISSTIVSRYPNGKILVYDESQIELRVAALLSGDPVMIREYREGVDRHTKSALFIFPDADTTAPDWKAPRGKRQLGKKLNFLVLYDGKALKFQETCLKELGIFVPLEQCQDGIRQFDHTYAVFRDFQRTNRETVRRKGYLELPTGWSRNFGTDRASEGYVNEIANMPVQAIAVQIVQSAQFEITNEFLRRNLKARVVVQTHDSMHIDTNEDEGLIDSIVIPTMEHPPLLVALERYLGRSVPFVAEKH